MRCVELGNALEQIVPRNDKLESELRMHFLIARRHILNRSDDGLQLFFRIFELLMKFYDLFECGDLLFRVSRFVESGD